MYQRILWRFSPEEPVTEYILLTVTYGLRSAPYLAGRSLHQLAGFEGASIPRAAQVLTRECYVDDLMTGADSVRPVIQDALQLQSDVTTLLSKGGFKLRKWSSNNSALLSKVPTEGRQTPLIFNTDEIPSVKVLGLQWCPRSDTFGYIISPVTPQYTKRAILSDISKLFDPMGWLSPVMFLAKYFIQRLWLCGAEWDDEIPEDIKHAWNVLSLNSLLSNISLPRLILPQSPTELSLIVFSDASEKGYAAVAYLHAYNHSSNTSKISLLMGKSRVAPLKTITVPRLELCVAVLAAKVLHFLLSSLPLSLDFNLTLAFSDSSTVLGWIRTPPHLLRTFVSNRVVQILDVLSPSNWYHVSTSENPADCASRGLLPNSLLEHPLWFTGPSWLSQPLDQWPLNSLATSVSKLPELRPEKEFVVAATQCRQLKVKECNEWITRFSSFSKLKRFTAWALRLFQSRHSRQIGPMTTIEIETALLQLVSLEQSTHFQEDILILKRGDNPSSALRSLNPFLDLVGIVRVGGRLRHADIAYDARHPILLPKKCALTNLIIDYFHLKYFHIGPRTLQSFILRSFWIISGRQAIRSRLSKFLPCLKMRAAHIQPQISNLPLSRVRQGRPFLIVGTDFGGPFIMKESNLRKSRTSKVYLCLFVCFVTKAVHLEIVSSLSTEAFLAAFERFISRRGKCTDVYSDWFDESLSDLTIFLLNI